MSLSICTLFAVGEETASTQGETVQQLPKLLDLGAHKCIPCQKMAPILDELTKEYKGIFDVEFIDVWQRENKEKAIAYGIQSIPTQIFFDADGTELWRHQGFISKADILAKWAELGFSFKTSSNQSGPIGISCCGQ
jgi:thioredoxin 1